MGDFCRRASLYAELNSEFGNVTNFFGAASMTTRMLANIDRLPVSAVFINKEARQFLRDVSFLLELENMAIAGDLRTGALSGSNLDDYLVTREQNNVQNALDALRESNPEKFSRVLDEINELLNAKEGVKRAAGSLGSDGEYQDILDKVREKIGSDINFENQEHREEIGKELIDHVKSKRPDGWSGCDSAGCSWNEE
jgi:hypothetical protein